MWGALLPMGIGAGIGLLTGGAKGAVKGAVTGGATAGMGKLMPAANGLLPAKATAANVGNFLEPTMPQIGGANLYSSGVVPPVPDPSVATPLMSATKPELGGMNLMPGEHDWMKGMSVDPNALGLLGGQQQQQPMPSSRAGMKQANAPSSDEIAKLLASVRIPEREKLLNLFWS